MTATLTGKSTVSGAVTQGAATLTVSSYDLAAAAAGARASNNDAALPAGSMSGGALSLTGGTLTLPAGDYYLTGLSLAGQASLAVSGRVNIFLHGPLTVRGGSSLNGSGDAGSLWIVSGGAGSAQRGGRCRRPRARRRLRKRRELSSVFLNGTTLGVQSLRSAFRRERHGRRRVRRPHPRPERVALRQGPAAVDHVAAADPPRLRIRRSTVRSRRPPPPAREPRAADMPRAATRRCPPTAWTRRLRASPPAAPRPRRRERSRAPRRRRRLLPSRRAGRARSST